VPLAWQTSADGLKPVVALNDVAQHQPRGAGYERGARGPVGGDTDDTARRLAALAPVSDLERAGDELTSRAATSNKVCSANTTIRSGESALGKYPSGRAG
jgi:hypothetical protein